MGCPEIPKLDLGEICNSEDIFCYLEELVSIGEDPNDVIDWFEYVIDYTREGLQEFKASY